MLVFSRCEGESIIVGGDIKIEVLSIDGGRVNLGINVPPPQITRDRDGIAKLSKGKSPVRPQKRRLH